MFAAAVKAVMIWLAFVGVLNAIVGLYYYLVVLKVVYVSPAPDGVGSIDIPATCKIALVVLSLGIILIGYEGSSGFVLTLSFACDIIRKRPKWGEYRF